MDNGQHIFEQIGLAMNENERKVKEREKRLALLRAIGEFIGSVIGRLITAWPIMLLWNDLMIHSAIPKITYWQAVELLCLISCLLSAPVWAIQQTIKKAK